MNSLYVSSIIMLMCCTEIGVQLSCNFSTSFHNVCYCGPGNSVGVAIDYGLEGPGIETRWGDIFHLPDRPWGPHSLPYIRYRVFPGGKVRPGRAADHSPPSSAVIMEEQSYTATHPPDHNRACNGITLPFYS